MISFERDESGVKVHKSGVIAQLCSLYRSHEQGLPEWFKNASAAYARMDMATDSRLLTLMMGFDPSGQRYIALLDHGGMSVEDLEQKFANWGDPEAHLGANPVEDIVEGGHGNGGKCYMTQMFGKYSYLHSVRNGRGSRYGFVGDDPHPGYFPNRREGRGFPVERASDELRRALAEIGVDFSRLPDAVRTVAAIRDGFTLVVGIEPKQFEAKDAERKLLETVLFHPQMALTTEKNQIYVMLAGVPFKGFCPVTLPEIEPHEMATEPRVVPVPLELKDPITGENCKTQQQGFPPGRLVLKTSKTSMMWPAKRGRHHIRYLSGSRPIAFLRMENVSRSSWVDKMYGECLLDSLAAFETPDRSSLADAPLTRAVESWIKEQVFDYENEFKQRERLSASQEQKNKLRDLNDTLDQWKNRFLEETMFGAGVGGPGESDRPPKPPRPPRHLRQVEAAEVAISTPFSKAGVGVWLRFKVEFLDAEGSAVAPPPYLWHSSDWAVATVDENRVITHSPGEVDLWVETLDGRLRSAAIRLEVLDTVSCRIEPTSLIINAGQVRQLAALVTDRAGGQHTDVYMTWIQDDSSVVYVTGFGRVIAKKQGETKVYAADERCMEHSTPARVVVQPSERLPGDDNGRAYPRILLSEVDPDPLNPDGESVHLGPEDGPVHQPTPQHVDHNIWWINLQCPLAKYYIGEFGASSREWRAYHIERYIEALVKIRLHLDFQLAEEELNFDSIERRWREVAAEVQKRAMEELRPLLEGERVGAG
jgi:hypothetical protein